MGFSAGASIAFEIAQRLKESDKTVENLVFLDGCPSYEKRSLRRKFAFDLLHSMNILRNLPQDFLMSFESSLTGDVGHDFLQIFKAMNRATGYELTCEEADAYAFLTRKLAEHIPGEPYHGDVVLIKATDPSLIIFASTDDYNVTKFCTGRVPVHEVAGNHLSFLSEDSVDATANILNEFLS